MQIDFVIILLPFCVILEQVITDCSSISEGKTKRKITYGGCSISRCFLLHIRFFFRLLHILDIVPSLLEINIFHLESLVRVPILLL